MTKMTGPMSTTYFPFILALFTFVITTILFGSTSYLVKMKHLFNIELKPIKQHNVKRKQGMGQWNEVAMKNTKQQKDIHMVQIL